MSAPTTMPRQPRADFVAVSWWPDGSPRLVLGEWWVPDVPGSYMVSMEVEKPGTRQAGIQSVSADEWVKRVRDPDVPQEVTLALALWLGESTLN